MSKLRTLIALLASLFVVLLFAKEAHATHFRYGNITYTVPDPVNAPLTVRFDVVTAWRQAYVDKTALDFGDGNVNGLTEGLKIGEGVDVLGEAYQVQRYSVTHTYPSPGLYTASFNSCCRISSLSSGQNDDDFRVWALVDVSPGNTGNAVSAVPPIFQLQIGGTRTIDIPAADPDGVPVHCRFGTSGLAPGETYTVPMPPPIPGGNVLPVLSDTASGCQLSWNLTTGQINQKFALSVVLESLNGGTKSESVLDFIVEFVASPPPTCSGGGLYNVDLGTTFTKQVVGTSIGGGNLTMTSIGTFGNINPVPGTIKPSPFTTNYSISPSIGDSGVQFLTVLYTTPAPQNLSGFCTLIIKVAQCPVFGEPCSTGVGGCVGNGYKYCSDGNQLCSAVAGLPVEEKCDLVDNDCDGAVDEGDPEVGAPCTSPFPGVCSEGTATACNNGVLVCEPDIAPGSVAETCDGVDQDCDGTADNGFNVGTMCVEGDGQCNAAGLIVCDGQGAATCNAEPAPPKPESCDGKDNDCDLVIDEDFPLGDACKNGVGACETSGSVVCNAAGGTECDAVPGLPSTELCGNAVDEDCDGALDNGCVDGDGDGLFDPEEIAAGLDPNDADSDDDGALDSDEPGWNVDSDGDGLINALDPDSDDDGLFDGTELGFGCDNPDTKVEAGVCIADADPATTTNPLDPDSDTGGGSDGSEDWNLDGKVDANETDPAAFADDEEIVDTDGDGLGDQLELTLGGLPNDADSDDDGLLDGLEPNPGCDSDGDGLKSALDVDSDNDGLFDGTEAGKDCNHPQTQNKNHCKFDGDPASTTAVLAADTDGGGRRDGAEDTNLNGVVGQKDTDPADPSDDALLPDNDGDGLSDELEATLGSNWMDKDSDDDGVLDGDEPNPADDADGDGQPNIMDADSDNDGLFDGTELGLSCTNPHTDLEQKRCVADGDQGATKTNPLLPDTDKGGAKDGDEDANHNGIVNDGETDPNDPMDDVVGCMSDAECGESDSGKVCDAGECIDGCRGQAGNGCPMGETCTSTTDAIGTCEPETGTGGTGGTGGSSGTGGTGAKPPVDGGGCGCRTAGSPDSSALGLFALFGLAAAAAARRRRR